MKTLTILLLNIFVSLNFTCYSQQKTEVIALNYLMRLIGDNGLSNSKMIDEDMAAKLHSVTKFYSDGQICMLSRPVYYPEEIDDSINTSVKSRVERTYKRYIAIKNDGFQKEYIKSIDNVNISSFDDFESKNDDTALFFIIRKCIDSSLETLVEIHAVTNKNVDNYTEYTFHIYLDSNQKFMSWDFSQQQDFEDYEPCF
ncbi:MAG: hypothetical protein RLO12_21680 [Fulvivirga sp.]